MGASSLCLFTVQYTSEGREFCEQSTKYCKMLERFRSKFKGKSRGRWKNDSVSVSNTNEDNAPATTEPNNDATSTRDSNTPSSKRNLWEVAGERLEEKHRIALDLENASPVAERIDDVIKTTEEKYREYQEGGLKIRKRGGGQINIRDSAKNIISYTLQAKDLVKALTSFDSTGYGKFLIKSLGGI